MLIAQQVVRISSYDIQIPLGKKNQIARIKCAENSWHKICVYKIHRQGNFIIMYWILLATLSQLCPVYITSLWTRKTNRKITRKGHKWKTPRHISLNSRNQYENDSEVTYCESFMPLISSANQLQEMALEDVMPHASLPQNDLGIFTTARKFTSKPPMLQAENISYNSFYLFCLCSP